ncbi:MAG TPA: hypothetical protein VF221_15795 [Chloroflexota bacterium]
MSNEDPRLRLLRQIPEWRTALDNIEWSSDTRSLLDTMVVASHGLRPLLRSDEIMWYVTSGIGVQDDARRVELAQDLEYAREQVRQGLVEETDPAMTLAHLHMAEALIRHVIDDLESAVSSWSEAPVEAPTAPGS